MHDFRFIKKSHGVHGLLCVGISSCLQHSEGGGEIKLRKKVRKCVVQHYNYFATDDIFETIGLIKFLIYSKVWTIFLVRCILMNLE